MKINSKYRGIVYFKDGHSEYITKINRNRNDITSDFLEFTTESGNVYVYLLDELFAFSERSIHRGASNMWIKRASGEYGFLIWTPTDEIERVEMQAIVTK